MTTTTTTHRGETTAGTRRPSRRPRPRRPPPATETTDRRTTTEATTEATTAETRRPRRPRRRAPARPARPARCEGLKGTTPLVELSSDFTDRLLEVDPTLTDYNYAAETYDAITIIALAVEQAQDDGIAYASEINGITRDGEKCTDFATCKAIIDAGGDVDLDGFSGPLEFAGNGEPLEASYGLLTFGADNRLDDALTEYFPATAPGRGRRAAAGCPRAPAPVTACSPSARSCRRPGRWRSSDHPSSPPSTSPSTTSTTPAACSGKPVVGIPGDSGDATTDTANQTVDRLLSQNVDAIIGAASSGVSLTVIDKITGAGVVQFSPANTSKTLSDYPDKGLYFRTAPSDILQGAILGEIIAGDGVATVGIVARNDSYGTGLVEDAHGRPHRGRRRGRARPDLRRGRPDVRRRGGGRHGRQPGGRRC